MSHKSYILIAVGVAMVAVAAALMPWYMEIVHRSAARGAVQGQVEGLFGGEAGKKAGANLDRMATDPAYRAEREAQLKDAAARSAIEDERVRISATLVQRSLALDLKRLEIDKLELELRSIEREIDAIVSLQPKDAAAQIDALGARGKPIAKKLDELTEEYKAAHAKLEADEAEFNRKYQP